MRSTHAPAGSPISRNAPVLSAVSRPIATGEACRTSWATSGTANVPTAVPSLLIAVAV
jgi:hypothetical protein